MAEIDSITIYGTTTAAEGPSYISHACQVYPYDRNGNQKRLHDKPTMVTVSQTELDGAMATIQFDNPNGKYFPGIFPRQGDGWTEGDIDEHWIALNAGTELTLSTTAAYGKYSLKATADATHAVDMRTPPTGTDMKDLTGYSISKRPEIHFWAKASTALSDMYLRIVDTDGDYIEWRFYAAEDRQITTAWQEFTITRDTSPNGTSGTMNWQNISHIEIYTSDTGVSLWIDGLYLKDGYEEGDIVLIRFYDAGGSYDTFFGQVRTINIDAAGEKVSIDCIDMLRRLKDKHVSAIFYDTFYDRKRFGIIRQPYEDCEVDSDITRYPSGSANDLGSGKLVTAQSTTKIFGSYAWEVSDPRDLGTDTGFRKYYATAKNLNYGRELWFWARCDSPSEDITIILQDSSGNTASWNVTIPTADQWHYMHISLDSPDSTTGSWSYPTSVEDIEYLIIDGIETGKTYYFDIFSSEPIMQLPSAQHISEVRYCRPMGGYTFDESTIDLDGTVMVAQRFRPIDSTLTGISLSLSNDGTGSGPLMVQIVDDDLSSARPGGLPDDEKVIACGLIQEDDSDITNSRWGRIDFCEPIELDMGRYYWMIVRADSATSTTAWHLGRTTVPIYEDGKCVTSSGGGPWTAQDYDILFQLHQNGSEYRDLIERVDFEHHENYIYSFTGNGGFVPVSDEYRGFRNAQAILNEASYFTGFLHTAEGYSTTTIWEEMLQPFGFIAAVDSSGITTDEPIPVYSVDTDGHTMLKDICQRYGYMMYSEQYSTTAAKLYIKDRQPTSDPVLTIVDGADWWGNESLSGNGYYVGMISHDLRRTIEDTATIVNVQGENYDIAIADPDKFTEWGEMGGKYISGQGLSALYEMAEYGEGILGYMSPIQYEGSVTIKGRADVHVGDKVRIYCSQAGLMGEDMVVRQLVHRMTRESWVTELYLASTKRYLGEIIMGMVYSIENLKTQLRPSYAAISKDYAVYVQGDSAYNPPTDAAWAKLGTGGTSSSTSLVSEAEDGNAVKAQYIDDLGDYVRYIFIFPAGNYHGSINEIELYRYSGGTAFSYAYIPQKRLKTKGSLMAVTVDVPKL